MEIITVSLIISVVALLLSAFAFFKTSTLSKKEVVKQAENSFQSVPLQLQAYERLALLCERISIPNLISRVNHPGANAKEMQTLLLESIKQEFEYNASQQIYISKLAWDAVRNLRDQSMLIINQVANVLPPEATATELNKMLLEVIMNHQEAALHSIVLDTLGFEAKQLMRK